MAKKAATFQYQQTMSINREYFMNKVVRNEELSRKALRVFLHLMTHLDSKEFKAISKKNIAYDLNMTKDEVSSALLDLDENNLILCGSTGSVRKGYKLLI